MFSKSLLESLKLLAKEEKEFPPNLMKKVWEEAEKDEETNLLSLIALREDMPEEVSKKAKSRNDIQVKTSYLSRKNIDVNELVETLRNEKRAGVLSGVYENLDEEKSKLLQSIFFEHFKSKPTKALGITLLQKPKLLDEDFAALIVTELAEKRSTLTDDNRRAFDSILKKAIGSATYAKDAIKALDDDTIEDLSLDIIKISQDKDILDRVIHAKIGRYVDTILANYSSNRYNYSAVRNAKELLNSNIEYICDETIRKIVLINNIVPEINEDINEIIERYNRFKKGDIDSEIISIKNGSSSEILRLLKKADEDKTVLSIEELLKKVIENSNWEEVIDTLMNYDHILTEERVFDEIKDKAPKDFIAHLYLNSFEKMITLDNYKSLGGYKDGSQYLCKKFVDIYRSSRKSDSYSSSYRLNAIGSDLIENINEIETLMMLPYEFYASFVDSYYYYNDRTSKAVKVITSALDKYLENDGAWDTFSVLSQDYQGTLEDLVNTSLSL